MKKIKIALLKIYFLFKERFLFKDKFNLKYYLYRNTRPYDTLERGVRTDDTTVLTTIEHILSTLKTNKNKEIVHCVDVGAFIGVVSLMMSKGLRQQENEWNIHCFEPYKDTFNRLVDNIAMDSCHSNFILNNTGLSDKTGLYSMSVEDDCPGQNHLTVKKNGNGCKLAKVKITTLSSYLSEKSISHVNLCKVDAEGVDHLVIKGLGKYLEKHKVDYFVLEYDRGNSQEQLRKMLSKYNYSIYYMVRNESYIVKNIDEYPSSSKSILNILAISPNADNTIVNALLRP